MTIITTRLTVASDGAVSVAAQLPAGEHAATITLAAPSTPLPGKPFTLVGFPIHDEPWDDSVSLRREDLYDDEGRLR
jgi:hypothetical protein